MYNTCIITQPTRRVERTLLRRVVVHIVDAFGEEDAEKAVAGATEQQTPVTRKRSVSTIGKEGCLAPKRQIDL